MTRRRATGKGRKKDHFILGMVKPEEGQVRITRSERYVVGGGTKETHEQAVEFVHEVDREMKRNPPETPGELRMIVRDAARKVGGLPAPKRDE